MSYNSSQPKTQVQILVLGFLHILNWEAVPHEKTNKQTKLNKNKHKPTQKKMRMWQFHGKHKFWFQFSFADSTAPVPVAS